MAMTTVLWRVVLGAVAKSTPPALVRYLRVEGSGVEITVIRHGCHHRALRRSALRSTVYLPAPVLHGGSAPAAPWTFGLNRWAGPRGCFVPAVRRCRILNLQI